MSAFEELRTLRAEEKVLVKLREKLEDQLNRLKVEELALRSEICANEKPESAKLEIAIASTSAELEEDHMEEDINAQPLLDLETEVKDDKDEREAMEEVEDDEEEQDDLTAFMTKLEKQQQQQHRDDSNSPT